MIPVEKIVTTGQRIPSGFSIFVDKHSHGATVRVHLFDKAKIHPFDGNTLQAKGTSLKWFEFSVGHKVPGLTTEVINEARKKGKSFIWSDVISSNREPNAPLFSTGPIKRNTPYSMVVFSRQEGKQLLTHLKSELKEKMDLGYKDDANAVAEYLHAKIMEAVNKHFP